MASTDREALTVAVVAPHARAGGTDCADSTVKVASSGQTLLCAVLVLMSVLRVQRGPLGQRVFVTKGELTQLGTIAVAGSNTGEEVTVSVNLAAAIGSQNLAIGANRRARTEQPLGDLEIIATIELGLALTSHSGELDHVQVI